MAFERLEAEIGLLLSRLIDHPSSAAEAALLLREKLNEMKAYGLPLPQDLIELEEALEVEAGLEAWARKQADNGPA
jgi:hypothetical protein